MSVRIKFHANPDAGREETVINADSGERIPVRPGDRIEVLDKDVLTARLEPRGEDLFVQFVDDTGVTLIKFVFFLSSPNPANFVNSDGLPVLIVEDTLRQVGAFALERPDHDASDAEEDDTFFDDDAFQPILNQPTASARRTFDPEAVMEENGTGSGEAGLPTLNPLAHPDTTQLSSLGADELDDEPEPLITTAFTPDEGSPPPPSPPPPTSPPPLPPADSPTLLDLNGAATGGEDGSALFVETSGPGDPVADRILLAPDAVLTDPDTDITRLVITLGNESDAADAGLSLDTGGLPLSVTQTAGGQLIIEDDGSGLASNEDFQQALRLLGYNNLSDTPDEGVRVITVEAFGGSALLATRQISLDVFATNDPPEISTPTSFSTPEDSALALSGLSVSDADAGVNSLRLTLSVQNGTLDFADLSGVTITEGSTGSAFIVIEGSAGALNAALAGLVYQGSQDFFGDDSLTITLNDLGHTGPAGPLSTTRSIPITVPPVGDPPVIDLDGDDSTAADDGFAATFTEGGSFVFVADTDIEIADNDDTEVSSATITLTNSQVGDMITLVGALPSGISVGAQNDGQIVLTGLASQQDYETAIRQIRFVNFSDALTDGTRSITVSVADAQGTSGNTATAVITVIGVPDPPVIDLNGLATGVDDSSPAVYDIGAGNPVSVTDPGALNVFDPDGNTIQSMTIRVDNLIDGADEILSVSVGARDISVSMPAAGVLVLSNLGGATDADFEAVLETLSYQNTAAVPNPTPRIIEVSVNDGDQDAALPALATVTFSFNTAPVIDLDADDSTASGNDAEATFTVGGEPVSVSDSDIAISDNGTDLRAATITLANPGVDDQLVFLDSLPSGISVLSQTKAQIVLGGAASLDAYERAVHAIAFENASSDPATAPRLIQITVEDTNGTRSNMAEMTVNFAEPQTSQTLQSFGTSSAMATEEPYTATMAEYEGLYGESEMSETFSLDGIVGAALTGEQVMDSSPQSGDADDLGEQLLSYSGMTETGFTDAGFATILGDAMDTLETSFERDFGGFSSEQGSAPITAPFTDMGIDLWSELMTILNSEAEKISSENS